MTNKLTLNLGVRYDLMWNMFQNQEEFLPFMEAGRPQNATNIQPRLGFAYQWNDRTVVRGGTGKYYGEMVQTTYPSEAKTVAVVEVANDGRPDFAANPFNGPAPTFEQALAAVLLGARAGGELRRLESARIHRQRAVPAARQRRAEAAAATTTSTAAGRARSASSGSSAPSSRSKSTTSLRRAATKDGSSRTQHPFNPATGVNYPFYESQRSCRTRNSASSR